MSTEAAHPQPVVLQMLETPHLLPVTEARQNFKKLVDGAAQGKQVYVLVSHSTPKAVLLSYETFLALRKQLAGEIYRAMRRQSKPAAEPHDEEVDEAVQEAVQAVRQHYA
jgi:prevent-host-death family protein